MIYIEGKQLLLYIYIKFYFLSQSRVWGNGKSVGNGARHNVVSLGWVRLLPCDPCQQSWCQVSVKRLIILIWIYNMWWVIIGLKETSQTSYGSHRILHWLVKLFLGMSSRLLTVGSRRQSRKILCGAEISQQKKSY